MPKLLTETQVRRYREEGFCSPAQVLNPDEYTAFRRELEAYELVSGHTLDFPEKLKPYLLFKWADAIVHHPLVLDAVEDLIGPDILAYHATMWIKDARQAAFVRWHQDGAYFFLDPPEQVTAWVALSDASVEAGCMQGLAGTHRLGPIAHDDKPAPGNLIKRGQGISDRFDRASGTFMPLAAGEMSLHHTFLVHSSGPNNTDDRRLGLGISYIPAHVKPLGAPRPTALLVRGEDRYGHFVPEKRLEHPATYEAFAAHREANALFRARQDAGFMRAA